MKISNLIVGSLIFFTLVFIIYFFQKSDDSENLEIEIEKFNKSSSINVIEIENPIFKSKGLNSKSYIIRAKKGIQDKGDIELYFVDAEFEGDNKKIFSISADKGLYTQQNETIKLFNNVIIVDELMNQTSTKEALIDIKAKKITMISEVISQSENSSISSNSSIVDKLNGTITYIGNVKVKIENE